MSQMSNILEQKSSRIQDQLSRPPQVSQQLTMDDYFNSYPIKDIGNFMVSSFYSQKILSGFEILINIGAIEINRQRQTVQSLLDREIISEEQLKAMEQKQKKQFMKKQLQLLNNQVKPNQQSGGQINDGKNLVLSKQEHKALAKRFKEQYQQRQKRHQQLLLLSQQRQQKRQQQIRRQIQQKQRFSIQLRREQIQSNLAKNKKRKEQFWKLQKQSNSRIKEIKSNKQIYDRLQYRYKNEIVLPILQQKQKKLKQIHQQKLLNIEQIKEHQKSYLQKLQLRQSRRTIFHDDWNYNPPDGPQRLKVILEYQQLEKLKKSEQKKIQLQQNLSRHAEYAAYLRRNFIPKIDPAKKEQIQLRKQKAKIIKPESLDYRTIGMSYLQQAKRKRKKISPLEIQGNDERPNRSLTNTPYLTGEKTSQQNEAPMSDRISINKDEKSYIIRKRENLKKLLKSDQLDNPEKIKQLTIEASKIEETMQRKQLQLKYKKDKKTQEQALQLLLSSIEAKIGIIETNN